LGASAGEAAVTGINLRRAQNEAPRQEDRRDRMSTEPAEESSTGQGRHDEN